MKIFLSILLCLGSLSSLLATEEAHHGSDASHEDQQELAKRLYDFGIGKRASRYGSEFKRLPMYDFGLGKRAKMYGFGLGKRSEAEVDEDGYDNYLDDGERIPETEMYDDEQMQAPEKRKPAYAFGLGKRPRYEFGLGKRAARQYSFGLGKRERMYSFGLGKRAPRTYSFGLGKRGDLEYSMEKREISQNELKAVAQDHEEENVNSTAVVDSHEVMGHGDRSIQKRSPRQYSFGLGKRDNEEEEDQSLPLNFVRQYRKPAYSFGLGKRSPAENLSW